MKLEEQKLLYEQSMPKGRAFYDWIFSKDSAKEALTLKIYETDDEFKSLETYDTIPEFLQVLYKVATCGYGCTGGSHVIEYITGRGYNLGIASLKLLRLGFYDESLSLVRSISEIVNLFALFGIDPDCLPKWYNSTGKERIREFSPANVREKLSNTDLKPPISKEYYSKMCEVGVHVNPQTKPQGKNHIDRALVGGFILKEQAIAVLNDLANNLGWLVIMSLRNSVDEKTFIKEMDNIQPLYNNIGELSIESIDDYIKKNSTAANEN